MAYNYRCTTGWCRKRVRRNKPIEEYVRKSWTVCPVCGGNLSHDPHVKQQHREQKCFCDGFPYPHRKGSTSESNGYACIHAEPLPEPPGPDPRYPDVPF